MKTVKLTDVLHKTLTIKWKEQSNRRIYSYIDLTSVDRSKQEITQTSDICARNAPSRAQKIIKTNDILFGTTRPTLNRLCIVPETYDEQICSTGFCVLRANTDLITPSFIYYLLTTKGFVEYVEATQRGTSYPAVTDKDVKQFEFTLPPLEEQRQIVARLDAAFEKIDRAIELTQQNIDSAEKLFANQLTSVFYNKQDNWLTNRLDTFCVLQRGHDLPKSMRINGKYKLASSSGIIDTHSEFKAVGPGVFTGRSGTIGNVFYEEDNYWPLNTVLYVKEFYDNQPRLIYYLIKSLDFKQYAGGTGVPTLNRNNVHSIIVSVPQVGDQIDIAKNLDSLSSKSTELKELYREKIQGLKNLKQSMLMQAFNDKVEP